MMKLVLVGALGIFFLSGAALADVSSSRLSLPKGPGSIEGLASADLRPTLSTGTANYSIPIAPPPSARSFSPQVSFDYNSGSGVSELGIGWSLGGIAKIVRRTNDGLPRFDETDRFGLVGLGSPSDLIEIAPGQYRPQFEDGSFLRIRRDKEQDTWEVRTKSGVTLRLGGEGYAEAEGDNVVGYLLREQIDLRGNRIRYEWETKGGYALLSRVVWNELGQDAENELAFKYEERPDPSRLFSRGIFQALTKRIARVDVLHGGDLVRRYEVGYSSDAHPRLEEITLVGADGKTKLPAAQFEYSGAHLSSDGNSDSAQLVSLTGAPGRAPGGDAVLADLNGDALPDLLIAEAGKYRSYINQDGHSFADGVDWATADSPSVSLSQVGTQLADVDGDGAIDLLAKSGTSQLRYFTQSTAAKFTAAITVPTVPNISFEDPNVRLTDIDGDRRTDVVYTDDSGLYVAYNQTGTDWALPVLVGRIDNKQQVLLSSAEVELCDINGDQLQDICVLRSQSLSYYLGRGRGQFAPAQRAENVPSFASNARFRHFDLNGDGWDDLVRVGTNSVFYALAIGEGTYDDIQTIENVPDHSEGARVEFADMNGSGTVDILWVNVTGAEVGSWQYLELFPEGRAGLLTRIDNGLGKVQTLSYAPAAQFAAKDRAIGQPWTTRINVAMPVVSRVQVDASLGDPLLVSELQYRDGTYDAAERTFAAFGVGITTSEGDESTPSLQTEEHFDTGLAQRGLRGVTTFSESRTLDGHVFSRSSFGFTYTANGHGIDGTPVNYGYQSSVLSETIEGDEASARSTLKEIVKDQWGNVIEERDWGLVETNDYTVGGDETITRRSYAQNQDDWVLGRLASEQVTDLDGHMLAAKRNFYDGKPFKGLSLGQLTRGELTRQEEWVGPRADDYELVAATQYDDRGLPIETRNGRGGAHLFHWSDDQTSLLAETVVLDEQELTETAKVDPRFGNVLEVTNYSGQTRRYSYDTFGRVTKVIEPGDSEDLPTIEYRYETAPALSRIVTLSRVSSGSDAIERSESLFDGLGRKRATLTQDGDRWVVAGVEFYNARGKVFRSSDPRWAKKGEYPAANLFADTTSHFTWFDAQGREVKTRSPEGVETRTEYGVFEERHWDGGQNDLDSEYEHTPTTTISDARGHVIAHQRTLDGELLQAEYDYDLLGRLVHRRDPENNEQSYAYDARGRLTQVIDPDLGEHQMSYDASGNLLRHRHPDGKSTDFTYDLADRVLSEDWDADGKNEITYFYDEGQGKLGRGKLLRVDEPTGFIEHKYDERGLIVQTEYQIDGTSYIVRSEFDGQGRERVHIYPDGSRIELKRNQRSQLSGYGDAVEIEYGGDGLEVSRRFNTGVAFKNSYDKDKRRRELKVTSSDGTSLEHLKWNFDQAGNLLSLDDLRPKIGKKQDRSESYSYDNLYRLVGATGTWGTTEWEYSSSGNLLKRQSTIAAQNTLAIKYDARPHAPTAMGKLRIKYDERGRMLDDGERKYKWNGTDQLTRVEHGENWTESEYGHDGVRRLRREHTKDGTKITHFIDGWSEFSGGKLVRYIVHAERRIVRLASDEERSELAKQATLPSVIKDGAQSKTSRPLNVEEKSPPRLPAFVQALSTLSLWALTCMLLVWLLAAALRHYSTHLGLARARLAAACIMGASLSLAACSGYGTGSGDESTKDGSAHDEGSDAVWIRELTAADTILLTDLTDSSLGEANGRGERTAEVSLLPYGFARTDTSLQTNVYSHSPRDRSVGLDHMGARFYAPELGVWTSGDPAILTKPEQYVTAEFGAANAYAYANLRPVVAADRDGQFWHVLAGAAAGGFIGGTVEAARQYFTTGKVGDFGRIKAAAGGGAVSGAIVAATPVASLASVLTVGAGSNVAGGVVTRLLQSGGKSAGTVNDVAVDASVGLATAGIVKGGSSVLRKVAQKPMAAPASSGAVAKTGAEGSRRVGYHATKPEYVDSITSTGLRPSAGGRAGSGVYVNNTIRGARAEFEAHNPGITPAILKVDYHAGESQLLEGLGNPYIKGAIPLSADSLSFHSVRLKDTVNTVIRNNSIRVMEVSF